MKDWQEVRVGDILITNNDKSKQVKSSDYQTAGTYPIVDQSADLVCGYCDDERMLIHSDLPYTVFGDHTRHTKFVDFPFVAGAEGTQILKPANGLDDRFFFYLVSNASENIGNYGYDRHFKHLKEFRCSFPLHTQEQTQIATILSTIDRAIEQTKATITKQQRIKSGLMQDLLTRGIDQHGNIRSEQTHQFKDSPLGRIPVEWQVKNVECLAYVTKLAGFEFTNHFDYRDDGEIIALRALNIKNEQLDLADIQRISKKVSDRLPRSKINQNDILITYIGAYIGDVLRIEESDRFHLAPNIAKIVCRNAVIPAFFELVLRSQYLQRQIRNLTATTATPSLTMTQIRSLVVGVPASQDEQLLITQRISYLSTLIQEDTSNLNKLKREKSGLMQDLLTGRVRVTRPLEQDTPGH